MSEYVQPELPDPTVEPAPRDVEAENEPDTTTEDPYRGAGRPGKGAGEGEADEPAAA